MNGKERGLFREPLVRGIKAQKDQIPEWSE